MPPLPTSPFDRPPDLPSRPEDEEALEPGLPTGAAPEAELAAGTDGGDEAGFSAARAAILGAVQLDPELRALKDRLRFQETREGLRVEILDGERLPMFPIGSDLMFPHTRRLLRLVAEAVVGLPNRVSIRGHTDSLPFAAGAPRQLAPVGGRANATRLALIGAGLAPGRVAEVIGKADAEHLFAADPADPSNRRISVVLLSEGAGDRDRD